ncbi:hypothetical protein LOTGIDRAFT_119719 [Lottia gigantea]|uniref:Transcription initiation protein SPT3 homolog n=1 Tax=Lottia gigantea TaxID=225164 RepID=V4BW26_LOTGI|nr:hypothetical protein LOTGIDRAFT_119719 [Lottia gigantea]ESO93279.1 hypothetical protein LOTGIDRAFT_119719 [Lottia gigantea]
MFLLYFEFRYGFGDCKKPLHDSASLIQDIVHQQLVNLLHQASEVASTRNSRFISIEDIVFLMRKDKVKLRRLLRYMKVKDTKAMLLRSVGTEDNEEIAQPVPTYKRRKVCYDFLSSIDQTGELVALFDDESVDEIKHERLMRAELQSRNLDTKSYTEFCEARQAGFSKKYKFQRFKEWIMAGINLDIKPNLHALEVVSYLAYETVAEIVDLALLVKQDMRSCINDPMIKNTPQLCQNYHNAGDLFTGTNKTSTLDLVITPSDIQEAMRRYSSTIGPFASSMVC